MRPRTGVVTGNADLGERRHIGNGLERSFVVTPSMRTLAPCTSGSATGIGADIRAMCPPARSLSAGWMPL